MAHRNYVNYILPKIQKHFSFKATNYFVICLKKSSQWSIHWINNLQWEKLYKCRLKYRYIIELILKTTKIWRIHYEESYSFFLQHYFDVDIK